MALGSSGEDMHAMFADKAIAKDLTAGVEGRTIRRFPHSETFRRNEGFLMLNLNLRHAAALFAVALIMNFWPGFARAQCARVVSRGSAHSEKEIAESVNLSINF